jgi:hypothetical protein
MLLIEVTNASTAAAFIDVNVRLNQKDPNYVRPLNHDIHNVFDPQKNKLYQEGGNAIRWILKSSDGSLIGRIAAFFYSSYQKAENEPAGCCGFFDCINDQAAANCLFDAAKNWLQQQGCTTMDGPVNFGERHQWWGCVVEGFLPPLYCMNYNPPYYQALFEHYGFQNYYNMFCFGMPVETDLTGRFTQRHARFAEKPDYYLRTIDMKNLDKYIRDFHTVYNAAWASHGGGKEMSMEQATKIFDSMKQIMDPNIAFFVYYKEDPVAMWLNIPELNEIFRFFDGKLGLWQKIRYYWLARIRKVNRKMVGIIFGVVPKYQALGIDSFMILEGARYLWKNTHYKDLELQWQGEWNPKMLNISKSIGATVSRRLVCYRYLFDRNRAFERYSLKG